MVEVSYLLRYKKLYTILNADVADNAKVDEKSKPKFKEIESGCEVTRIGRKELHYLYEISDFCLSGKETDERRVDAKSVIQNKDIHTQAQNEMIYKI